MKKHALFKEALILAPRNKKHIVFTFPCLHFKIRLWAPGLISQTSIPGSSTSTPVENVDLSIRRRSTMNTDVRQTEARAESNFLVSMDANPCTSQKTKVCSVSDFSVSTTPSTQGFVRVEQLFSRPLVILCRLQVWRCGDNAARTAQNKHCVFGTAMTTNQNCAAVSWGTPREAIAVGSPQNVLLGQHSTGTALLGRRHRLHVKISAGLLRLRLQLQSLEHCAV